MPVSAANLNLYEALKDKRWQLYLYSKRLYELRDAATQFIIDPELGEINLEMLVIDGMIDDLNHNNPMNFPSAAQFASMQADVATLRNAIGAGAAIEGLMAAGGAVLAAWPS